MSDLLNALISQAMARRPTTFDKNPHHSLEDKGLSEDVMPAWYLCLDYGSKKQAAPTLAWLIADVEPVLIVVAADPEIVAAVVKALPARRPAPSAYDKKAWKEFTSDFQTPSALFWALWRKWWSVTGRSNVPEPPPWPGAARPKSKAREKRFDDFECAVCSVFAWPHRFARNALTTVSRIREALGWLERVRDRLKPGGKEGARELPGTQTTSEATPLASKLTSYWPDPEFLEAVADEVHALFFPPAPPSNMEHFNQRVSAAIDQENRHAAAEAELERKIADHYEKIKRDRHLRDKKAGPPKKGWLWVEGFSKDLKTGPLDAWAPPKLARRMKCKGWVWDDPIPVLGKLQPTPPEIILPGQYVILAIVHDNSDTATNRGRPRLLEGFTLPRAFAVMRDYGPCKKNGMRITGFDRKNIERALRDVKADLAAHATSDTQQQCTHSDDFTSVVWYGTRYVFNKTQARCVALLWDEWEKGRLTLGEQTIAEKVGSENLRFRLRHVFRVPSGKGRRTAKKARSKTAMHPAWGTMVVPAGKGIFKLACPESEITE